MSKVKLHPTNDDRVLIELTAIETRKLLIIISKGEIKDLDTTMLSLRDKLDLILDHVKELDKFDA